MGINNSKQSLFFWYATALALDENHNVESETQHQYLKEAMPPKRIIDILRNNLKTYKKEENISTNDEKVVSDFLDWVLENQF